MKGYLLQSCMEYAERHNLIDLSFFASGHIIDILRSI